MELTARGYDTKIQNKYTTRSKTDKKYTEAIPTSNCDSTNKLDKMPRAWVWAQILPFHTGCALADCL